MGKRTIWFIINPVSGIGRQKTVERLLPGILDTDQFDYEIKHTTAQGDARRITREAIAQKVDIVVAVGGDGTIGEVASELVNSEVELGIIPAGSGNGMARGLQIPVLTRKAIRTLNNYTIVKIDTGNINGKTFANSSGVGFDALISKHFYHLKNRGLKNYIRLVAREYFKYKPRNYKIEADGKQIETRAWVVSFANSPQYGNNAIIAPGAIVNDKLLDVVIVRRIPFLALPVMIYRLFKGSLDRSRYFDSFRASEIKITLEPGTAIHLDGDPHELGTVLDIKIVPQSVKVIVPIKQMK